MGVRGGRPVGLMLAWLEHASSWDAETHRLASRVHLPRGSGPVNREPLSLENRASARRRLEAGGKFADLFRLERHKELDEPDEPVDLF